MYYQKNSEVRDQNMDCGRQASYKIIQQFPKGSDTALPKGVNYQSYEVATVTKSPLNEERGPLTIASAVNQRVDTVKTEDLTTKGTLINETGLFLGYIYYTKYHSSLMGTSAV